MPSAAAIVATRKASTKTPNFMTSAAKVDFACLEFSGFEANDKESQLYSDEEYLCQSINL